MREWLARLADWFRRDRLEQELVEEMRFHQREVTREAEAEGATPEEAARIARRRLGNTLRAEAEARDRWSFPVVDHARQDLRDALRGLRRAPGFAVTVVATLGLGIGANIAMFDVTDRLMFRPLALLHDPATVHRVYMQWQQRGRQTTDTWVSYQRYQDLQTGTSSFSSFAAFADRSLLIGSSDAARELRVAGVTASFFDFFDVTPVRGRFFGASEDVAPFGADVAVLSEPFWLSEFGGRNVLGETLQVGNIRATIIGVTPRAFAGVNDAQPPVLFLPLTSMGKAAAGPAGPVPSAGYQMLWGHVLVRRQAGVPVERANAEVHDAFRRSWELQRQSETPVRLQDLEAAQPGAMVAAVRTGAGPNPTLEASTSFWLMGVAVLVLVIATVNVAGLLFARTLARRHEAAVRVALGITKRRLVARAVTESLVLATIGACVGVLVAHWGGGVIRGVLAPGDQTSPVALIEWRTLGLTVALTLACGLAAGAIPAWLSARTSGRASLGAAGRRGVSRAALPAAFVVMQGALSVTLLVGAVLFVRSLVAAQAMPMGYDASRVLVVTRVLRGAPQRPEERLANRQILLDAARALPQVEHASWMSSIPLGTTAGLRFSVPGVDAVEQLGQFTAQETTADYFKVMRTRILRGRAFTDEDRAGAPRVVVVSEGMARELWPGVDAIGRCIKFGPPGAPCTNVVGIAEDIVQGSLTSSQRFHYYLPVDQTSMSGGSGMLLRLHGDPAVDGEAVRRALQAHMAGLSYLRVQPLSQLVDRAQRSWRLGATLFLAFGVLALAVAATGVHGLFAFSAAQRMPEFGLRAALGAGRWHLLWLVLAPTLRYALAGIASGTGLALVAGRWVQPLLFQQSVTDPIVYIGVGLAMIVVSILASLPSATRASGADPNITLQAG